MCLVGYQCGGEAGTLGSDGVRTLGRDEGSLPRSGGGCGVGVGGVWTAQRRIYATWKYELRIGEPKESEGCEEIVCLMDRIIMMSSTAW